MHNFSFTIIGGGAMGTAIVAGMLAKEFISADHITVCDPNDDQLKRISELHAVRVSKTTPEIIRESDWILLAVKPQHLQAVLAEIKPHLTTSQLIISIAAGASLTTIVTTLQHDRVVRVMPNTPAQVGCGMSAWITTEGVTAGDKKLLREFLATLGTEIELNSDDEIDRATAIHGSGPGYFFYIIDSLMHAALELGFSHDVARTLAVQTAFGAGVLAKESTLDPAALMHQVTSKGGGTEAALAVFDTEAIRERFISGIHAAYRRYKELS